MTIQVDLSIGPVQGFVAQSRRTRDLWGSSYLLSFLSAHAMKGAHEAGGKIIRPHMERLDDVQLLQWVAGGREGQPPQIGSVPNHFVLEVEKEQDAGTVVASATSAFHSAWAKVCSAVWSSFVEGSCELGVGTQAIWARQISGFWEVVWASAPSGEVGLLHRRKHWRTHRAPDEPGDKCMVMPELQELSGHVAVSRAARERQVGFWRSLAASRGLGPLDLRDEERLCALAIIKRLYPKVAAEALGWGLDSAHWRSTVYVGAQPWIRKVVADAPALAASYAAAVTSRATRVIAEDQPALDGWSTAGDFARLDANYFHASFVDEPRLCPLDQVEDGAQQIERRQLAEQLLAIQKAVGSPPPIFYAVLLADGDRLGDLVAKLGGATVGAALTEFTTSVEAIVRDHDGVTIYAGGDDVLAMLPVDRALMCAQLLSERYAEAFERAGQAQVGATLSAAVVFAHVRLPLRAVLGEAHRLLEDVAKEANQRDSVAVGVLKRGGLHCEWTSRWRPRDEVKAVDRLTRLVERLGQGPEEPGFSATLLHRLHTTLSLLCGWPRWRPGAWATALAELDVQAFLAAEVRRSLADRVSDDQLDSMTREITQLLVELVCRGGGEIGVDVLLLAHFLASGGAEEVSA